MTHGSRDQRPIEPLNFPLHHRLTLQTLDRFEHESERIRLPKQFISNAIDVVTDELFEGLISAQPNVS